MGTEYVEDNDTEDAPPLASEESSYVDIRKTIMELSELQAENAFATGFTAGFLVGIILTAVLLRKI